MANYTNLITAISNVIKQNGNEEITGQVLQNVLTTIVNSVGSNYTLAGVAYPATVPGSPDQNIFYIAAAKGVYSNFGGITLAGNEIWLLKNSDSGWVGVRTGINVNYINAKSITYAEIKALVDSEDLERGMIYRITDYVATTVQKDTTSGNHPFDIIVSAFSETELCEDGTCVRHQLDTYFGENDLSGIKIKYSVKNDTARFRWADPNGKGVIYYMEDSFGNSAPFDFKGIKFKRTGVAGSPSDILIGSNYYYWLSYIDSSNSIKDLSNYSVFSALVDDEGGSGKVYGNKIGQVRSSYESGVSSPGIIQLPKSIILYSAKTAPAFDGCFGNVMGCDCSDCTLQSASRHNTFGEGCMNINLGPNSKNNTVCSGARDVRIGVGIWNTTIYPGNYDGKIFSGIAEQATHAQFIGITPSDAVKIWTL